MALFPLKYERIFSKLKRSFSWGDKLLWGKNCWEVILNGRTNDQIIARVGRFGEEFHK